MRRAIDSVLPEPAPAITSTGVAGCSMTADCSAVGTNSSSRPGSSRTDFAAGALQRAQPMEVAVVAVGLDVGLEVLVEHLVGGERDARLGDRLVILGDRLVEERRLGGRKYKRRSSVGGPIRAKTGDRIAAR